MLLAMFVLSFIGALWKAEWFRRSAQIPKKISVEREYVYTLLLVVSSPIKCKEEVPQRGVYVSLIEKEVQTNFHIREKNRFRLIFREKIHVGRELEWFFFITRHGVFAKNRRNQEGV